MDDPEGNNLESQNTPIDVAVEIIDAVKEMQRLNPEKLKSIFGASDGLIGVDKADWADILLPNSSRDQFCEASYKTREDELERRRKKLGIKEPGKSELGKKVKLVKLTSDVKFGKTFADPNRNSEVVRDD